MKVFLITTLLTLVFSAPCYAGSCADTQSAANKAMQERNGQVKDSHNTMMPDPEDTRGPFSDCLSSINSIGDAFSLGISLPSMDQIIGSMCRQVDALIQDKMNDVLSEVKSSIPDIGGNNPFQVAGSASGISHAIIGKLK
ncbi:MAG: hypothetical protein LBQ51_00675 [Desulfovibrio sp.]|jgi:hypothetical protein|nr:hypothetical protein [Desulfovibrio sp.]